MTLSQRLLAGGMIVSMAACGWLYRENRELRNRIVALSPSGSTSAAAELARPEPASGSGAGNASGTEHDTRTDKPARLPWTFSSRERPTLETKAQDETRAERRQRRQAEIAAMLGRLDGETEDEYRARMVPFVKTALLLPRERLSEARRLAEEAAGVTAEQRAELDAAFGDVYSQVMDLTNRAIAEGDLTPYERNWAGALSFAGGMGAVLGDAEGRIAQILSPDQRRIMYEQGFEWVEYLGVTAPWEQLAPPPPPPPAGKAGL